MQALTITYFLALILPYSNMCECFEQAIQTHRVAHSLWVRGKRVMALALQSRASEVFAVDIHPGARIGACACY